MRTTRLFHALTLLPLFTLIAIVSCGGKRVLVTTPARFDLRPYGRLGLVTFSVENAKGNLHEFATTRFAENVLGAQPGIEVLEIGNIDTLMQRLGERELGLATAQELGKRYGVGAVFAGHLKVTNPRASGGIASLVTPHLEATVRTDLAVRLLVAQSGATVWRASAWATQKVGGVSIVGGQLNFNARDPNAAYGPMVNTIVNIVTEDLRSTSMWVKQ